MSLARLVGSDGLGSASLLQDSQVGEIGSDDGECVCDAKVKMGECGSDATLRWVNRDPIAPFLLIHVPFFFLQVSFLGRHQSCSKRPKPTVDVDLGNSRSFVFSRIDPSPKETPTAGPKAAQGGQQHGQQGGPVAQKASFQGVAKELDRPATAQPSSDAENRGVPGLLSLLR